MLLSWLPWLPNLGVSSSSTVAVLVCASKPRTTSPLGVWGMATGLASSTWLAATLPRLSLKPVGAGAGSSSSSLLLSSRESALPPPLPLLGSLSSDPILPSAEPSAWWVSRHQVIPARAYGPRPPG